ncbi:uncharacterized protein ND-B14.5B [Linepithema humile]|uniref:uncharacterized protein ND-B14.5B n=1 Tax=Linepithema humile TaxID=83485 RepID=UPI0006235670|nr:PREDICTED: NADH dehydrogenase [ubiquinone] 1 subunit C2 [Linepithema humile]
MSRHHEHEISEHPEIQWALDLLKPDPSYEPFLLQKYASEIVCIGSCLAGVCLHRWFNRRPVFSGIQGHIASIAGGYFVSQIANRLVETYHAEHDTRLRDYIIRHPELFPEPERVKFSEILEEWAPIR